MSNQIALPKRLTSKYLIEDETDCWIWLGYCNDAGYALISVDRRTVFAHRYVYELTHGAIPDGMLVCHRCDEPSCINPDHLFVGTQLDNMQDMFNKRRKRIKVGEEAPRAKLWEYQVREILASRGITQQALANRYHVTRCAISLIQRRLRWSHL